MSVRDGGGEVLLQRAKLLIGGAVVMKKSNIIYWK